MAEIDGFKYEPWSTDSTARRDFRHANGGPEALPHRGKSKGKPRRYDRCSENNGRHLYVVVKEVVKYSSGNEYTYVKQECLGCGKAGKGYHNYVGEVYQTRVTEVASNPRWYDAYSRMRGKFN